MPQLDDAAGVKAHYLDEGTGPSVVVLHGGLETADNWAFLAEALVGERRVLRPERRGHGRTPDVEGPHTYEAMAEETAALIDQVVGEPVDLVGFSDGAITAMLLALARPELVRSMVVISGHLHHEALLPRMAERLANPDPDSHRLAPMREAYARTSPDGADHWPSFHRKVSTMGATSPALDPAVLRAVTAPVLVVAADDDVVDLHHVVDLYEALPDGRLAILPHTSHLLHHEAPGALVELVRRFLAGDEPPRLMPMRSTRPPDPGAA